jgi:hypothetical protein
MPGKPWLGEINEVSSVSTMTDPSIRSDSENHNTSTHTSSGVTSFHDVNSVTDLESEAEHIALEGDADREASDSENESTNTHTSANPGITRFHGLHSVTQPESEVAHTALDLNSEGDADWEASDSSTDSDIVSEPEGEATHTDGGLLRPTLQTAYMRGHCIKIQDKSVLDWLHSGRKFLSTDGAT